MDKGIRVEVFQRKRPNPILLPYKELTVLFTGDKRDVFFVSVAKRKSQKTGELQRQNAVFAFCVHREACYCSRNCCFLQGSEQ
jgi:hypothetical protein